MLSKHAGMQLQRGVAGVTSLPVQEIGKLAHFNTHSCDSAFFEHACQPATLQVGMRNIVNWFLGVFCICRPHAQSSHPVHSVFPTDRLYLGKPQMCTNDLPSVFVDSFFVSIQENDGNSNRLTSGRLYPPYLWTVAHYYYFTWLIN